MSIQEVRTALKHLKSTGELTDWHNSKIRIITVNSYDEFQSANRQPNRLATGKQQPANSQPTADIRTTRSEEVEEREEEEPSAYDPLAGVRKRYDDL
jgi:hypothetical protein